MSSWYSSERCVEAHVFQKIIIEIHKKIHIIPMMFTSYIRLANGKSLVENTKIN